MQAFPSVQSAGNQLLPRAICGGGSGKYHAFQLLVGSACQGSMPPRAGPACNSRRLPTWRARDAFERAAPALKVVEHLLAKRVVRPYLQPAAKGGGRQREFFWACSLFTGLEGK